MEERSIHVKTIGDKWCVAIRVARGSGIKGQGVFDIFIKMSSKEDAVRYARVCEQRTGRKVHLPK